MSFTATQIAELEALLSGGGDASALVAEFRSRFPGKSLTRCDASDMGTQVPFRRLPALDLHLVDGRDHCWRCTDNPAAATGVVLARRSEPS